MAVSTTTAVFAAVVAAGGAYAANRSAEAQKDSAKDMIREQKRQQKQQRQDAFRSQALRNNSRLAYRKYGQMGAKALGLPEEQMPKMTYQDPITGKIKPIGKYKHQEDSYSEFGEGYQRKPGFVWKVPKEGGQGRWVRENQIPQSVLQSIRRNNNQYGYIYGPTYDPNVMGG